MQTAMIDGKRSLWRPLRWALLMASCVLVLGVGACATPPLANGEPAGSGAAPAAPATPAAPTPKCEPEPFCMSECKRQGYPMMYCNLRCGC